MKRFELLVVLMWCVVAVACSGSDAEEAEDTSTDPLLTDVDYTFVDPEDTLPETAPDTMVDTIPGEVATDTAGDALTDGTDALVQDDALDEVADTDTPLCTPGDLTCTCTSNDDCDPFFGDACRVHACDLSQGSPGHCKLDHTSLEGNACDDGDPCTDGDSCQAGVCTGPVDICECTVDLDCDDWDPCTDDLCSGGTCSNTYNTAPCDDGNDCTAGDACSEGACMPGESVCNCTVDADCETNNQCSEGACEEQKCSYTIILFGSAGSCDDGDACTDGDKCVMGQCQPGANICEE